MRGGQVSVSITRRLRWESAHRVLRHESKCSHLHGHSYVATVEVEAVFAAQLSLCCLLSGNRRLDVCTGEIDCVSCGTLIGGGLDEVGRVIDFAVVKDILGTWVDDHWDHGTLVNPEDESLQEWLAAEGQRHWVMEYTESGEPTAEEIARALLVVGNLLLREHGVRVVCVTVRETENCTARVRL